MTQRTTIPSNQAASWEKGGAPVTWALGLGGLFLSEAVATGGIGAFCLEQLWGGGPPGEARPAAFPSSLGPGHPSGGLGDQPPGPASPRALPSRPRPALPAPPG